MEQLKRSSGVLLHITSLPNEWGLGTFSHECENFIDFLSEGGFKCWQVLPFADCGYAMSPYQAVSSFGINPYFIDITEYLSQEEIWGLHLNRYNENKLEEQAKFDKAHDMIYEKYKTKYDRSAYNRSNSYWLEDYALYKAIKESQNGASWNEWPQGLKNRVKEDIDAFKLEHKDLIDKIKFLQYIADTRWKKIKSYANSKGIEIFGDIPMYVTFDSADVWSNPKYWQLDEGKPKMIAGVPPDYFNAEGQLWGNPLYNYTAMSKNKYDFWIRRFKRMLGLCDIIRIDHFVAFSKYWAIPYGSESAKDGKWMKGAGLGILKAITNKYSKAKIVAEDLGIVSKDVIDLRNEYNIPGLKVMQFAFDGDGDNEYQPHNYEKNTVAYIGTHDNNTFMGLLNEGNWDKINRFKRYLRMPLEQGNDIVVDNAILSLYRSSANMIILTAQDILKLGEEARMNVPGTLENNWLWQLSAPMNKELCAYYKELSELYAR